MKLSITIFDNVEESIKGTIRGTIGFIIFLCLQLLRNVTLPPSTGRFTTRPGPIRTIAMTLLISLWVASALAVQQAAAGVAGLKEVLGYSFGVGSSIYGVLVFSQMLQNPMYSFKQLCVDYIVGVAQCMITAVVMMICTRNNRAGHDHN